MKERILLFCLSICINFAYSQSVFQEYKDDNKANYLSINPTMFKLLGQINIQTDDLETKAYLDMIQSISSFKVLTTQDIEITKSIDSAHKKWAEKEGFELLLQLNENDNELYFYVVTAAAENIVNRLLMFSRGSVLEDSISIKGKPLESILLLVEGRIDLEQIGKLTEAMELPGGKQLKKIN